MNRDKEPLLFDLPQAEDSQPVRRESSGRRGKVVALFPDGVPAAAPPRDAAAVVSADSGLGRRLGASLITGALQALGLGGTIAVAWSMLPPGSEIAWVPLGLFGLLWSCAFVTIPLAFFRRTAGMALMGLQASSLDRSPLSFGQAFRRWLGSLLTVALVGLPGLLAATGRSLADRLSGSRTLPF